MLDLPMVEGADPIPVKGVRFERIGKGGVFYTPAHLTADEARQLKGWWRRLQECRLAAAETGAAVDDEESSRP